MTLVQRLLGAFAGKPAPKTARQEKPQRSAKEKPAATSGAKGQKAARKSKLSGGSPKKQKPSVRQDAGAPAPASEAKAAGAAATGQPVGATGGIEVVTVEDGRFAYRFSCRTRKDARRAGRMLNKERGTIAWLDREVRPDDVFYDIGANIGVYTLYAAYRLGDAGAVYSFEPHIPNASTLLDNIFLNGLNQQVSLITSALTNEERFDKFNYLSINSASSTSQFGGTSYEGREFDPVFVEIKHGCSIDRLLEVGALRPPNLVKIDVDGLDFEVLEGMSNLLKSSRRPRSIQVELGSDSKPKIMKLCDEAGYELAEKHWSEAGLNFIEEGGDPEDYPHYGIFNHREAGKA